MIIEKNGKHIRVDLLSKCWKLSYKEGKLLVEVKLSTKDYLNIEDVKKLIKSNNLF